VRAGLDDFFAREPAGIIVEDDNRLAPGAYAWMCEALDRYADAPTVGVINAWAHRRFIPADVTTPWWSMRWSGWGWGAWRRTWQLMSEPVESLLARLAREGIDASAYGEDVVTTAKLGYWDSHLGLALYGARMLTLYPPRSLADHIGVGRSATNQQSAGQWRSVPAAPLTTPWPWPTQIREHPQSAALWRLAAVADIPPARQRSFAACLRRRMSVMWHRLERAWPQWPRALALRLTLWLYRVQGGRPYEDDAPGVSTPMRFLWREYLVRHHDAFYGRALEVGDTRTITGIGGAQLSAAEAVDVVPREGVQHVCDLQQAWELPEGAFDLFVNQFTLHLIADDRAALWHSIRALRDEGTLLVNFPCTGTASYDGRQYGHQPTAVWRWYTMPGVMALLAELGIDAEHADVEALGGAAATAAYLLGAPVETMSRAAVRSVDEAAPLLIAARITKPVGWTPRWSPART
jgi:hypothetical protein